MLSSQAIIGGELKKVGRTHIQDEKARSRGADGLAHTAQDLDRCCVVPVVQDQAHYVHRVWAFRCRQRLCTASWWGQPLPHPLLGFWPLVVIKGLNVVSNGVSNVARHAGFRCFNGANNLGSSKCMKYGGAGTHTHTHERAPGRAR